MRNLRTRHAALTGTLLSRKNRNLWSNEAFQSFLREKGKAVPFRAMKAYKGSKVILNFGAR
jgi:hypothetical protein